MEKIKANKIDNNCYRVDRKELREAFGGNEDYIAELKLDKSDDWVFLTPDNLRVLTEKWKNVKKKDVKKKKIDIGAIFIYLSVVTLPIVVALAFIFGNIFYALFGAGFGFTLFLVGDEIQYEQQKNKRKVSP